MSGRFLSLKRFALAGVLLAVCVGGFLLSFPTAVYAASQRLSDFLEYEHIGENSTIITKNGEMCVLIEDTLKHKNEFKLVTQPDYRKDMYDNWQGFVRGTDLKINAAHIQATIPTIEDTYTRDILDSCYFRVRDFDTDEVEGDTNYAYGYDIFVEHTGGIELLKARVEVGDTIAHFSIRCGRARVKGTEVRMRSQANTNCDILGVFDDGESVECLGYVKSENDLNAPWDWALVRRSNGREGFIFAEYLNRDPLAC